jgi:hypothetical protein
MVSPQRSVVAINKYRCSFAGSRNDATDLCTPQLDEHKAVPQFTARDVVASQSPQQ